MVNDFESCYRFMQSRDPRYDGFFFVAVTSTRVYCRPSCPARTPKRANVRFFSNAGAAQAAGFRACKRCRPDAAPGSPAWNRRADVARRAMGLIADGAVERDGVPGLAAKLSFSERHLRRMLIEELGAGPIALARAQRAYSARLLIESTRLPFGDVAFAAGFRSIRQFNETIRGVYACTPSELRGRASNKNRPATPGTVEVRLACREPFDGGSLLAFLGGRAIPGVEEVVDGTYRRSLSLSFGSGLVELTPEDRAVRCVLWLDDLRDLTPAVARCRRLLDLDADPVAVDEMLAAEKVIRPLIRARKGVRVPGCVDGGELAMRALLGQQVSVRAARSVAARLAQRFGEPVDDPRGGITYRFPAASALAESPPDALPGPRTRREALHTLACQLADGTLAIDVGADAPEVLGKLRAIRGIGPWTASYVAMRGLGDPDAFLATDVGVARALRGLGESEDPRAASRLAEGWRPWRSYAVIHLWTSLNGQAQARGSERATTPREKV